MLAADAWGQGFATEALGAMVDVARRTGVLRLYALCHADHRAPARLLEKGGFALEGTLRRHTEYPNLVPGQPQGVRRSAMIFDFPSGTPARNTP